MNMQAQEQSTPQVFFMPTVFNETLTLLKDARDYFQAYGQDDQVKFDESMRAIYSSEMSRITLRLSTIMAWTMAQRAVLDGKITPEDASRYHALCYQDVCRVDSRVLHGVLPSYVCYLLDRSFELYERVARLDDNAKRLH